MAVLDAGRNGDNLGKSVMEKHAHNGLQSCVRWLPRVPMIGIAGSNWYEPAEVTGVKEVTRVQNELFSFQLTE